AILDPRWSGRRGSRGPQPSRIFSQSPRTGAATKSSMASWSKRRRPPDDTAVHKCASPESSAPTTAGPGGWWFATEAENQLAANQVFRPDVAGWRRERLTELPSIVPIVVPPDWVCEILSKNRRND